jgi:tRNA(Arg) A34 adenosine deaminase TadA
MTARAGEDFETAWALLELPIRRSLEHAYAALIAGGLGCGAVLTDASGAIVAEGRNRAYDPPGGDEILQGTPIAHAEMNVLAAVSTDLDLTGCILWTTQEPCSMCTAAMAFAGVGVVRYVAPDPWAIATRAEPRDQHSWFGRHGRRSGDHRSGRQRRVDCYGQPDLHALNRAAARTGSPHDRGQRRT